MHWGYKNIQNMDQESKIFRVLNYAPRSEYVRGIGDTRFPFHFLPQPR